VAPAPAKRHEQRVAPFGLRHRLIERHTHQCLAVQGPDEEMPLPRHELIPVYHVSVDGLIAGVQCITGMSIPGRG
jgi:hypothetical protein